MSISKEEFEEDYFKLRTESMMLRDPSYFIPLSYVVKWLDAYNLSSECPFTRAEAIYTVTHLHICSGRVFRIKGIEVQMFSAKNFEYICWYLYPDNPCLISKYFTECEMKYYSITPVIQIHTPYSSASMSYR